MERGMMGKREEAPTFNIIVKKPSTQLPCEVSVTREVYF